MGLWENKECGSGILRDYRKVRSVGRVIGWGSWAIRVGVGFE